MYSSFKVKKRTGTYSDVIETFGLANLLNEIQNRAHLLHSTLSIEDKSLYYEININPIITDELLSSIQYFPLFKWAINKEGDSFDDNYFDYPAQKKMKKEFQDRIMQINIEFARKEDATQKQKELKALKQFYLTDQGIAPELDVYQEFINGKPNIKQSFEKLYNNFKNFDRKAFPSLIKYILDYYSDNNKERPKINAQHSFTHSITSGQILSPTNGLGLLKDKANGLNENKPIHDWVPETMKISGALTNLHCKPIQINSNSWDLKIVVPDFHKTDFQTQRKIINSFKNNVKGNTPIKTDILNLLILIQTLIDHTEEVNGFQANNIISGLFTVYQKDMGNNKAVTNISKLQIPSFIKFNTPTEAKEWAETLHDFIRIVLSINEKEEAATGAIIGLSSLRNFLTCYDFANWTSFIFWYSNHIMLLFSQKRYALPFKKASLDKFIPYMNTNHFKISEIISNAGFRKVAYAIRKSTLTLQYIPKDQRKFEIRYGLAQSLQNKSKSTSDLAEFIGEFIGIYNAETAMIVEKTGRILRENITDNELTQFYELLDHYPSKVVGALLASYGFALSEKEISQAALKNLSKEVEPN